MWVGCWGSRWRFGRGLVGFDGEEVDGPLFVGVDEFHFDLGAAFFEPCPVGVLSDDGLGSVDFFGLDEMGFAVSVDEVAEGGFISFEGFLEIVDGELVSVPGSGEDDELFGVVAGEDLAGEAVAECAGLLFSFFDGRADGGQGHDDASAAQEHEGGHDEGSDFETVVHRVIG